MQTEFFVAAFDTGKECAIFTSGGMEGVQRKKSSRPVSLISLAARQSVDQAVRQGLCYKKFTADITLDCEDMPNTGTILKAGSLKLGILPERKRCWPECVLLQEKLPCPLIDGVRYAWVEQPGRLCRGDHLVVFSLKNEDLPGESQR